MKEFNISDYAEDDICSFCGKYIYKSGYTLTSRKVAHNIGLELMTEPYRYSRLCDECHDKVIRLLKENFGKVENVSN